MEDQQRAQVPPERARVSDRDRQRAKKACIRCKHRKSRCIVTPRGPCSSCERASKPCSYVGEREQSRPGDSQTTAVPSPTKDDGNSPFNDAQASNQTRNRFPDLVVEDLTSSRSTHEKGGLNDLLRKVRSVLLETGPSSNGPRIAKTRTVPYSSVSRPVDQTLLAQVRGAFPPQEVAQFLLGVCMDFGTDFMFYFPQRQFRQRVDEFYRNPNSPLRSNINFLCMALSSFALGADFAHLVKALEGTMSHASAESIAGTMFYNEARKLLPDIMMSPSVESVQELALLGSYSIAADARGSCYLHLGLALRVAVSLGLHQQSTNSDIAAVDLEIRNRTWWTVLLMDRITSIKLGLPESIRESEITVPLPRGYRPLDSGQYHNNFGVFSAYLPLTSIWRAIASAVPQIFLPMTPENWQKIQSFADQLREWKSNLPPNLQLQEIDPASKIFRTVIHLYQNYQHAWITLCRFPLNEYVRKCMDKAMFDAGAETNISEHEQTLSQWCLEAAEQIVQLIELLRNRNSLAQRSFTDFQGCVVAILTIMLHGITDRNSNYDRHVGSALSSLAFMAARNESFASTFGFVQGFKRITDEAYESCQKSKHVEHSSSSANDAAAASYESWLSSLAQQRQFQQFSDVSGDVTASYTSDLTVVDQSNEELPQESNVGRANPNYGSSLDDVTSNSWRGSSTNNFDYNESILVTSPPSFELFADWTGLNYFDMTGM